MVVRDGGGSANPRTPARAIRESCRLLLGCIPPFICFFWQKFLLSRMYAAQKSNKWHGVEGNLNRSQLNPFLLFFLDRKKRKKRCASVQKANTATPSPHTYINALDPLAELYSPRTNHSPHSFAPYIFIECRHHGYSCRQPFSKRQGPVVSTPEGKASW